MDYKQTAMIVRLKASLLRLLNNLHKSLRLNCCPMIEQGRPSCTADWVISISTWVKMMVPAATLPKLFSYTMRMEQPVLVALLARFVYLYFEMLLVVGP